jgi:hypothetical protein
LLTHDIARKLQAKTIIIGRFFDRLTYYGGSPVHGFAAVVAFARSTTAAAG